MSEADRRKAVELWKADGWSLDRIAAELRCEWRDLEWLWRTAQDLGQRHGGMPKLDPEAVLSPRMPTRQTRR